MLVDPRPVQAAQAEPAGKPAPVLGGVAIVGLVALNIVGCYIYYPPPEETLEDLRIVRADALSFAGQHDAATALPHIERYDELTSKLQIGDYLRHGSLDEFQRLRAKLLRGWIEQLKDALQAGERDHVRELSNRVFSAHRRCSRAFTPERS